MQIKKAKFNEDISNIEDALDSFLREIELAGLYGKINHCIDEWIDISIEFGCLSKA